MDMFKMMKEAMAMRSRLSEMEKVLKAKTTEIEVNGIRITINAKSEILAIKLPATITQQDVTLTEKQLLAALTEAGKKSQAMMMEEAKKMTGGMNIPGMLQ